MKIKRVYLVSVLTGYLTFIIGATIFMLINDSFLGRGFVLLIIGGVLYIPMYSISNLTQFLLVNYPQKVVFAFFSSIAIMGVANLIGIQLNILDDFLWQILIPSQIIVSLIGFYYYKIY